MNWNNIENTYISCGSSIRPNCIAWGKHNVMCFGNKKSVVIAEFSVSCTVAAYDVLNQDIYICVYINESDFN